MKRLLAIAVFVSAASIAAAQTTPVLVPILYNGVGRFGSQWQTFVDVNNFTTQTIEGKGLIFLTTACPIPEGCVRDDLLPDWVASLTGPESTSGLLLHVPADEADGFEIQAHFAELTRHPIGIELPIARERDFRTDAIVLPRVLIYPSTPARTALRIYSPEPDPIQVRVELVPWYYRAEPHASKVVTLSPGDAIHPAFAQLELQSAFGGEINGLERIRVVPLPFGGQQPRIWAFATLVDNVTNEVSVFSPQ